MISSRITSGPEGRQLRASTSTQSKTMRAIRTSRYSSRTPTMMSTATTGMGCARSPLSVLLARRRRPGPSALVEERLLGDLRFAPRRHMDVGGREQEPLLRAPLDRPTGAEDEPRREVDEALGVRVVHL